MESYEFGMDLSMYDSGELLAIKAKLLMECNSIQELVDEMESRAENHQYASIELAGYTLMGIFENKAFEDCEGAGNCGDDVYTQKFMVEGKVYLGSGHFDYNRHDKTYYYIDEREWSYKLIDGN